MKIAIFGSGGVGGYFGGKLAAAGEDVTFLARGAHLAAMQSGGLHITSPLGDVHVPKVQATDRPQAIGPVDVVLFTVKLYDVDASAATLAPLIGPDTVVITLQNGVDAMDMVAKHVGADHVAGGAAYIVAVIDQPGHIRHTVAQQLAFGERDGRRSDRLARFEEAGIRAGFQAKVSTDVEAELWVKFVRLASWSGMTAATRSSLGVLRDHPETFAMMVAAIEEVMAVGKAKGVRLPADLMDHDGADDRLPARLEVVAARGSRARPPPRAAVAERRGGAARQGSRRAHANPRIHHEDPDSVCERPAVSADTIPWAPAKFMADDLRLRELMREYQSGRFEAFDEIYASIAPALRRYLLSQARDAAKADDLVQETFLQMHRARHTYDSSYPLMPWAMAIARHVWLMDRRTQSRRPWAPEDVTAMELPVKGEAASYAERVEVRRALGQVAPARREAVIQHHVLGFSFKEIAGRAGIAETAAKLRSSRGMAQLRALLKGRDEK